MQNNFFIAFVNSPHPLDRISGAVTLLHVNNKVRLPQDRESQWSSCRSSLKADIPFEIEMVEKSWLVNLPLPATSYTHLFL